jgi:ABC-type Fe2+-enterobactin transport system substrate-binding protein
MLLGGAWAWIKSKAGWVAVAFVAIAAIAFGSRASKAEIKSALALRRLTDATDSHTAAQARANTLKAHADELAEKLLAEELALAAEKKEADALDPDAVVADLKRRGLLKP